MMKTIRLLMITSDIFLCFYDCPNRLLLAYLLQSNSRLLVACRRYSLAEPNYGPLMFRCKEFLTSSAKEVGMSHLSKWMVFIHRWFTDQSTCVHLKLREMHSYITMPFCITQIKDDIVIWRLNCPNKRLFQNLLVPWENGLQMEFYLTTNSKMLLRL